MTWIKTNWVALATWLSVAAGFLLRFRQYLTGRSLWFDEALLAINIVRRSYSGLTLPLDNFQGAPILFLWVQKLLTELGGNGEWVLRLFPFAAGTVALLLFPLLASRYQTPRAALWAVILFAFSDPLIYYASEVKQYAVDVLATVLGLILFLFLLRGKISGPRAIGIGLSGVVLIWLSHPAIFTLASAALIVFVVRLREKDRPQTAAVAAVGLIWLLGFVANLGLSLDGLSSDEVLLNYWSTGFPPWDNGLSEVTVWVLERVHDIFAVTMEMAFTGLALLLFLLGVALMVRRDAPKAGSIVLPLLLAFVAALVNRYPFSDRLLLFFSPALFIAIAEGLDQLLVWSADKRPLRLGAALVLCIFLGAQVLPGAAYATQPEYGEQIRPVLRHVFENRRQDDPLYLYFASRVPFDYYQERFPIPDELVTRGSRTPYNREAYRQELAGVVENKERLWLVISHSAVGHDGSDEAVILELLGEMGGRLESAIQEQKAAGYLFTFPR